MAAATTEASQSGLTDHATLAKVDQLRALNVGGIVPLPQLVVVGDQSSGKSSVLESLTGFCFPRSPGLCTRYATQITCFRGPEKIVVVSIIPRPDADEALKNKLLEFRPRLTEFDNERLAKVFEKANLAMGIRMGTSKEDSSVAAFSQDILKIEIHGPEQDHITVIDVPGIFRVPTPGLTTESDITLVENMVKSYMSNKRTIILTVIPCNVDIATQEILKLAEAADPAGARTMGVLTKPDLATESATQNSIMDLLAGNGSILKLGYYVVKNRSSDDTSSTASDRAAAESAFFMAPPWAHAADRCGITALKGRLRDLLMQITKRELPHVKAEVENRLFQCQAQIEAMGPARSDEISQRLYLGSLASRFQMIAQAALNGYYAGDQILQTDPAFRLITRIVKLNETFSNVLWKKGHKQHFESIWDAEGESTFGSTDKLPFKIPLKKYPELRGIIHGEDYHCVEPLKGPIMDHIKALFEMTRGPEIGTFGGTVLATAFEEQSEKWEELTLSHTSKSIALVHDFIFQLVVKLCPEEQVRTRLWDTLLVDKLRDSYRQAMNHARFVLAIERKGRPITFNHYFNANLQKVRGDRMADSLKPMAQTLLGLECVLYDKIKQHAVDKDNSTQLCEDIVDILKSYYKVARKRFVDVVSQQVIFHYLLEAPNSPIQVLCPNLIMALDKEQFSQIAGEDEHSKHERQALSSKKDRLEAALKVLRS